VTGEVKAEGKTLVIVESPTKARTLDRYLGLPFVVMASGGHIIDLPPKRFGVDIDAGFKPEYRMLPGKQRIATQLKQAAESAREVYLATDPDREGEAIAWHISELIKNSVKNGVHRIQFNEVTRKAVQVALSSPGRIDMRKVDVWQARRIMDRLVGYQVSPILWKTITGGLSAGRVQSVALRLVCERQVEIDAFVKEEYWSIDGRFSGKDVQEFKARLYKLDNQKVKLPDRSAVDAITPRLEAGSYRITDVNRSRKKRQPPPPYITSTLQQDSGRRLRFSARRTMSIAQRLYEGVELGDRGQVGLITYMRTDSVRISNEAISALREWVAGSYGPEFLTDKPRIYKNKKGAIQDAHEAIRPTDIQLTPKDLKQFLTPEQHKLYDLIWRRFTATQMREAEIDVTVVTVSDGAGVEFRASGQVTVFEGFLAVYADLKGNGDREEETSMLPSGLKTGMPLVLEGLAPKQHFTQPPPLFTEASLVKELDERGIGRPSTYASIISTLIDRKYAELNKRCFTPTDLGLTVNKILVGRFPDIFNVEFTARMEEELDQIETGGEWRSVVSDFYGPFSQALKVAEQMRSELKNEAGGPVGRECPECGMDLVYRWGKRGRFISCSGFPKCRYAENLQQEPAMEVDVECPKCGKPMVVREGRYGRFLGCSNYPKCRGILPLSTGHKCPEDNCNGNIVERRSKKGRVFYGCDSYPKCRFTSWDPPVSGPCTQCGALTLFEKNRKDGANLKYCHRCDWKEEV